MPVAKLRRMNSSQLAGMIDHTILKPEATLVEVEAVISEGRSLRTASVCVAPAWVKRTASALAGSGVLTCTVAGFPHGTSKPTIKAIEGSSTVKDGADEVDVVAHLPFLIAHDLDAARDELLEVVRACRAARKDVLVKVIIESAALMKFGRDGGEEAIAIACRAAQESGCDFVKTSTGFHPAGGASVEAVRWMKKHCGPLKVKASGGIRDLDAALAMINAGADRLGLSGSAGIIAEMKKREG